MPKDFRKPPTPPLTQHILLVWAWVLAPVAVAQPDFFSSVNVEPTIAAADDARAWSAVGWVTQKFGYGLRDPGQPFARSQSGWAKA